jgi:hypothetical protein
MSPTQPTERARHRSNTDRLALFGFPPGAALFQRGVGVGFEVAAQRVLLLRSDVALCARDGLGGQGTQLSVLLEIPLDRTDANAKDSRGFPLGATCLYAANDSFSKIG